MTQLGDVRSQLAELKAVVDGLASKAGLGKDGDPLHSPGGLQQPDGFM